MMDSGVTVALIGAVPLTIAAVASWRNGRQIKAVHDEVKTGNGKSNGAYVVANAADLSALRAEFRAHAQESSAVHGDLYKRLNRLERSA